MPPPVVVGDSGLARIMHGELLNHHLQATPPGPARWALGLLADLAPVLDWQMVLALGNNLALWIQSRPAMLS